MGLPVFSRGAARSVSPLAHCELAERAFGLQFSLSARAPAVGAALTLPFVARPRVQETSNAADPVITVDHVFKRFGGYVAVRDADFTIARGEFFSMLGPSGCGKTTTLRMIAGFEEPTEGRILLEGRDVSHTPPYRRNVNTVFQHYALFPHMTVRDNVAFGPRSQKLPEAEIAKRVRELLDVVRLASFAER